MATPGARHDDWLDAQVPGGVHLDPLAADRIADPFVGDDELRVPWVGERDWEYRRDFTIDPEAAWLIAAEDDATP